MPSNPLNRQGFGPSGQFYPADLGLEAWNYDPMLSVNTSLLFTAGRLNLCKLWLPGPLQINNIHALMTTAGGALTAGQCFACVYDAAFNLVAITADQQATWLGATGLLTMAIASNPAVANAPAVVDTPYCYVGGWFNGTTAPTFRSCAPSAGVNGLLAATGGARTVLCDTGLTTVPPNRCNPAVLNSACYWFGIS